MRNIVIVEAISTGYNFIRDIVNRNYHPVILDMNVKPTEDNKAYQSMVNGAYAKIDVDYDLVYNKDTYEETLEMIREFDPILVLPGAERGVRLATRLANDLGLLCNPIENIDAMTLKNKMHERLAEKGVRHIRGRVVKSVEEAIEFYDEEDLSEVVVKPTYSAGSVGVKICLNKEEMINAFRELNDYVNFYGDSISEFIVQERIKGEEYIVNTVSSNGDHRVTTIWKYNKITTPEGDQVCDSARTINELGIGEAELVEYAYDVVDAIGIKYGPVHGEYMIDDDGPVLIEVNCRPSGPNMDAEYIDRISGQHETDSILDSYLNPENFYYERNKGYNLFAYGIIKLFIVPEDIIAKSSPITHISSRLKSHFITSQEVIEESQFFVKTKDVETTGGTVYLVHEDEHTVQKDLDFLRSVEKYAFDLVLSKGLDKNIKIDEEKSLREVESILNTVKSLGSTLFVTDQFFDVDNVSQISVDEIDNVKGDFKCVIVNLNKSIMDKGDDYISYLFLKIIEKVKIGGLIFIPQSTYQYTPHGRTGAEALVKVLDLKLELPLHRLGKMVIASKK